MPFEGYKRRDENSGYLQAGVVPKVTENGDGTLTQHVNIDSMPTGTVVVTSLPTGSVSVNNFPSFYSVSVSVVVTLSAPEDGSSFGCTSVDAELIKEIRQDPTMFYVNIHNSEFPSGALRAAGRCAAGSG